MGYSELKDRRYEIGSAGVVSLSGINYEREEFFFFFFCFPPFWSKPLRGKSSLSSEKQTQFLPPIQEFKWKRSSNIEYSIINNQLSNEEDLCKYLLI